MTADLFGATEELERIPMQDAEVYYRRQLRLVEPDNVVMRHLIDEVPWRAETVVVWGKTFPQP
ncbi:MAG: alpha-ketoglutarate-dependent dioxygenase AlkB, partial [Myxococcota bacterium]